MKRKSNKILVILALFLFGFVFVGCSSTSTNTSTIEPTTTPTIAPSSVTTTESSKVDFDELMESLDFNDVVLEYDGENHKITFDATLPEGYTYVVIPSVSHKDPGTYAYNLRVTKDGETKVKTVYLTIEKIKPTYLGKNDFTVYLNDYTTQVSENLSFSVEGIEPAVQVDFNKSGDYTVNLTTVETESYKSIDPVELTIHVKDSKLGLSFPSVEGVLTADKPTLSTQFEDVSSLPEGYTVSYENNEATTQGVKLAKGYVKNSSGEVVEEYHATIKADVEDDEEFEQYANEMLKDYIDDDQLAINIFFVNPENYGIEHGDASWYSYTSFSEYTDDEYNHDLELVRQMRTEYNEFAEKSLSFSQRITLARIDEYIDYYEGILANKNNLIMRQTYVDQYGGYASSLPDEIEAYSFRNKQDVDDCLSILTSVYDAFDSYYTFIEDREENGYGLSEYSLSGFISYLNGVVDAFEGKDGYYLLGVIEDKLDAVKISTENENGFLTESEVTNYKVSFEGVFNSDVEGSKSVYLAHKDLAKKTSDYLTEAKEGYLASSNYTGVYLGEYDGGKELYYSMLSNRLGLGNLTPSSYKNELDSLLDNIYEEYSYWEGLINKNRKAYLIYNDSNIEYINYDTIDDLIDYLKEFAKTIVPDLDSIPDIDVAYMDPTVTANTTTVAYYMKSPLDSYSNEYIHLNGRQVGKNTRDTATTLAHEGYPGHLYAYVYSKENKNLSDFVRVNTSTGHGEGWSKYVEYALLQHFIDNHKDDEDADSWEIAMKYAQYNELFMFTLYARLDFGINYEGWNSSNIASCTKKYGLSFNNDYVLQLFNEIPSQYAPYGYGFALFYSLHELAKTTLGVWYDEVEFNEVLLRQGWCGLTQLKVYVNEYLTQKKFVLNIV